jgi:hypothetical protein
MSARRHRNDGSQQKPLHVWFSVRRRIDSIFFNRGGCAGLYSKFTNCASYQKGWHDHANKDGVALIRTLGTFGANVLERSQFCATGAENHNAELLLDRAPKKAEAGVRGEPLIVRAGPRSRLARSSPHS